MNLRKRIELTVAFCMLLTVSVMAQSVEPLVKVDEGAMRIVKPIDQAVSVLATNWLYLASWHLGKTNLHWTTEGKMIGFGGDCIQYAHNIQKTGPLATNLQYGTNACIISIGAPRKLSWSGLGIKTTIAGYINDRDILVSCQTWNPENPAFEEQISGTVKEVVATLKATMETNSPSTSGGIRQPADGLHALAGEMKWAAAMEVLQTPAGLLIFPQKRLHYFIPAEAFKSAGKMVEVTKRFQEANVKTGIIWARDP